MKQNSKLLVALALVAWTAGCQQRVASKLQGRWIGKPDSTATRTAREANKYGDSPTEDSGQESDSPAGKLSLSTDWEKYEASIVMDFVSHHRLEMSLDGEQSLSGSWKVVSTSPAACTIEVATKDATERRRFELLLDERDGACVGFELTEAGADPRVGSLYFQRAN